MKIGDSWKFHLRPYTSYPDIRDRVGGSAPLLTPVPIKDVSRVIAPSSSNKFLDPLLLIIYLHDTYNLAKLDTQLNIYKTLNLSF